MDNNPLIYRDPTGHYKLSDNEELKKKIQPYTDAWNKAKAAGNKQGMAAAEQAADAIRVSYYTCSKDGYCGSRDKLPSDVKYRIDSWDMYKESKYGNAKEVPLIDDPMFYIIDGGAIISATLIKSAAKTAVKRVRNML